MRAFKWLPAAEVKVKRKGPGKLGCCCGGNCSDVIASFSSVNVTVSGTGNLTCLFAGFCDRSLSVPFADGSYSLSLVPTDGSTLAYWEARIPTTVEDYDEDSNCTSNTYIEPHSADTFLIVRYYCSGGDDSLFSVAVSVEYLGLTGPNLYAQSETPDGTFTLNGFFSTVPGAVTVDVS